MKIVFTAEHAGDLSAFHQLGELLVEGWALGKPKLSAGQLIELAHDAEVLVTSYDEVTDAVMAACPRLQVIACTRANPVNIDTQAAQARGIRVLYTPGRNADAAAELTLGLMLSLARHIPQSHAALKRGEFTQADNAAAATQQGLRRDVVWDVSPESPYEVFKGTELRNKTLGLVGYGNIGRRVARIARAFGMAVLVVDPFVAAEDINEPIPFHEITRPICSEPTTPTPHSVEPVPAKLWPIPRITRPRHNSSRLISGQPLPQAASR